MFDPNLQSTGPPWQRTKADFPARRGELRKTWPESLWRAAVLPPAAAARGWTNERRALPLAMRPLPSYSPVDVTP